MNERYVWVLAATGTAHVNVVQAESALCGEIGAARFKNDWNAEGIFDRLTERAEKRPVCKKCLKIVGAKRDVILRLGEIPDSEA